MQQLNPKKLFLLLTVITIGLFVLSCQPMPIEQGPEAIDTKLDESRGTQELKKFSSVEEIRDFLKNSALNAYNSRAFAGDFRAARGGVAEMAVIQSAAPQAKSADSGAGAIDYSQTNVQVEGVDEADFVKNDDKYIYVISQNRLMIIDAFPAENAKVLSETKIDGRARNMLVNKDRVIVFSDDNDQAPVFAEYDFIPRPRYTAKTHVFVYDISDRSSPKLAKDYSLNGNYFESRMIGEHVYFIVIDNARFYNQVVDLPVIRAASKAIIKPEIFYFDNPEQDYNFNTIAAFNVFDDNDELNAKTFMMGYSSNLYVSQNNIYIAYQKNLPYRYYEAHNKERFFNVVLPLLPQDARVKIDKIKKVIDIKEMTHESSYYYWDMISAVLEEMYNSMEEDEKEALIEEIEESIEEYEAKLESERRKTIIHKININKGQIEYDAKAEVPGYLLNQFSMDEHNNYFRVATTTEIWSRKSIMYNNVYALDEDMKIAGKLEAIAPDERIYSARFIGDRLYMVTFKRIDPLFVIDLSNPEKPEILGELKIPGYSDYIHPYDENHIIGIGKETDSNEWGGVSTRGVKLALFDVSDVKAPKQLDKYEIGEPGTDSEALHEHKAFLFDKEKNILVIPVREVKGKQYYDSKRGYYRQRFWQGAYVFGFERSISEIGFELKGKITHNEEDEERDYYYYGSPNAVRRSLYMDDALYTVSEMKIKANDLKNISKEIREIKLPEISYETKLSYEK